MQIPESSEKQVIQGVENKAKFQIAIETMENDESTTGDSDLNSEIGLEEVGFLTN